MTTQTILEEIIFACLKLDVNIRALPEEIKQELREKAEEYGAGGVMHHAGAFGLAAREVKINHIYDKEESHEL